MSGDGGRWRLKSGLEFARFFEWERRVRLAARVNRKFSRQGFESPWRARGERGGRMLEVGGDCDSSSRCEVGLLLLGAPCLVKRCDLITEKGNLISKTGTVLLTRSPRHTEDYGPFIKSQRRGWALEAGGDFHCSSRREVGLLLRGGALFD